MGKDPLEVHDYLVDETYGQKKNNHLLDDTGAPNPEIAEPEQRALAELAAAVHRNARLLTASQSEQAIRWLKRWKLRNRVPKREHSTTDMQFLQLMNRLKGSRENKPVLKRAYRQTLWARLWGALFAVSAAVTLLLFFDDSVRWYWRVFAVAVSLTLLVASDVVTSRAAGAYAEYGKRHLLQCIREAETIDELSEAGLFDYVPGARYERDKPFDLETSKAAIREARERLADALYSDPGYFVTPTGLEAMLKSLKEPRAA